MKTPPRYFEAIRLKAEHRWRQLESDRELAGPWHQLFKQVQSPRHVLSELLQNADDVGAKEAHVRVERNVFIFEHNGADFTKEHFESLCRFGYSNKRALHTIGFRGIGFKSTFSLGRRVELFTPTLAVSFDQKRFTEPRWVSMRLDTSSRTRVCVEIADKHRETELQKNLDEWLRSPISLLFFKNIRRLQIGDRSIHWKRIADGPVADSAWMCVADNPDVKYLLLTSQPEAFPDEALTEIGQERMLTENESIEFPPCKIEIVSGAEGRLFVVLPTQIKTDLPFACNAPFIQDPARLKIKDPETSPTNRWLLERAGRLAGSAMISWLHGTDLPLEQRAAAYHLLPDVDREDNSLEGVCGAAVEFAVAAEVAEQAILLTETGELATKEQVIVLPRQAMQVWSADQLLQMLGYDGLCPFCRHVGENDVEKLLHWNFLDDPDESAFLSALGRERPPKPKTWNQLLILWALVDDGVRQYPYFSAEDLNIVPVQGQEILFCGNDAIRLGEAKLLQSERDWEFLARYLTVLNPNWPRFLAAQRRATDKEVQQKAEVAYLLLEKTGLGATSDVSMIVNRVAKGFFLNKRTTTSECVRFAQISAKLGATAGPDFCFVTQNESRRRITEPVFFDEDGRLQSLLPEDRSTKHLLNASYTVRFTSCSREDWIRWVSSGRAGLLRFVPLIESRKAVYGRSNIMSEASKRGRKEALYFPYVTNSFHITDWDFSAVYWRHWRTLAADDSSVWTRIVEHIIPLRSSIWENAARANIYQTATTGKEALLTYAPLPPTWVISLRTLPCLPDTRGIPRKPDELMRRTAATEPFVDVEWFVHSRFDNEQSRPLLELLGVRSTPVGPDNLLERLGALALSSDPPVGEVEKWYRRLDQLLETCSTADFQKIKSTLWSGNLILSQSSGWVSADQVFLSSAEDDVPGAAVVRAAVADLSLWRKISIGERPTANLAIKWLKTLPSSKDLSTDAARRVKALLGRHPIRIWNECGHWINLSGEWVPIANLRYAVTMQSLTPWTHLHPWVKQQTANFQMLPGETVAVAPFVDLPLLAVKIEERFNKSLIADRKAVKQEWLTAFSRELRRVVFENEGETQRVRTAASRLATSDWHSLATIEIIPYIKGTPAGTPRKTDVAWIANGIFVQKSLSKAKLAKRVPEEIGRSFGRADIKAALDYSYERATNDIRSYFQENFSLVSLENTVYATADVDGPRHESTPGDEREHLEDHDHLEMNSSVDPIAVGEQQQEAIRKTEAEGPERTRSRVQPVAKQKASIIERFAQANGFRKNSHDRFVHDDGSWIARTDGMLFDWERHESSSRTVRYYYSKDICLQIEPLQLEAEVWAAVKDFPEKYALILSTPEGKPIEMTGGRLLTMLDQGRLTLYPATYRVALSESNAR